MATEGKDNWSSDAYQKAAGFVPLLAGKVVGWLDLQKDDVVLDIGCGDGVLDLEFGKVLAQGRGRLHGIDSSAAMIATAATAAQAAGLSNTTFEVLDANALATRPALQTGQFSKVFSNAALHWILAGQGGAGDAAAHARFFAGVHAALQPGGLFVLEMGGLGNVAELVTGIVAGVSRRIGLAAAQAANPWFFPDEAWARRMLEGDGSDDSDGSDGSAGSGKPLWKIEAIERQWRPTPAGASGVDGWVRLMARPFLDAVPDAAAREACTREVVELLDYTTRQHGGGGNHLSYVRLRVRARRL